MHKTRNFKALFRLCVFAAFSACLWLVSGDAVPRDSASAQNSTPIPVETSQMPPVNGIVPVELRCESANLSAPNAIENIPCVIRNNTNKFITAVTIATSFTLENAGKLSLDTSFLTIETFVHPDVRSEGRNKAIPPKAERPIRDLLTSYDDAVIKGVAMRVDYVEFLDNTALGPNRVGSRTITDIRAGAAKYKNWLIRKYNGAGKSIDGIVPLLESQAMSEELGIQNGDQEQGAIIYRRHVLETYKAKGREGLVKYLK